MSLETGQIIQDIGVSATISQLWGQNRLSLAAILAHELLGGAHHMLGGGVRPPTEASPHARGGVPTPPEASPHATSAANR